MNLANKITGIRILLIPVFLYFVYSSLPYNLIIATVIFILASITDDLDGYIARSRNEITKFGKFMDPLADKLMVMAALISLVEIERVDGWVVMVIIARELIITGFRAVAASDGIVIAASMWGKVKTVTQIAAVIAALLAIPGYDIFVLIALISTIVSGIDYLYKNRKVIQFNK